MKDVMNKLANHPIATAIGVSWIIGTITDSVVRVVCAAKGTYVNNNPFISVSSSPIDKTTE